MMREKGVVSLTWGEVSIGLGDAPASPVVEDIDNQEKVRKGKLGKDGLTAEEQKALYMRVIDAED